MLNFDPLTLHTSGDVFYNLFLHSCPIVMALDYCHCFLISRVPNIRHIMHLFQDHTPQFVRIGYINFVHVQEYSINF
jgi:hypothetical protein